MDFTLTLPASYIQVIGAALDEYPIPNKLYREIVAKINEQLAEQQKPKSASDVEGQADNDQPLDQLDAAE